MKHPKNIMMIVTAVITIIIACEKESDNIYKKSENLKMLIAAEEYDYTVDTLLRFDGSNSTGYEVIFDEHPVIGEYSIKFPDGIQRLKLDSKKDGIKDAYDNGTEYTFLLQDSQRLFFRKSKNDVKEEDRYDAEAIRMLSLAQKAGNTVSSVEETEDGRILIIFEKHPVLEEIADSHPEGITQIELDREKDRITGFTQSVDRIHVKIGKISSFTFLFDRKLNVTLLDSTRTHAFPTEYYSLRYVIHNESEYQEMEHNFHMDPEFSEDQDTVTFNLQQGWETQTTILKIKNLLYEYTDTAAVEPYRLKYGSVSEIQAEYGPKECEIDVDTNVPEEWLELEWDGELIQEAVLDTKNSRIILKISENNTIADRTGTVTLKEKDDWLQPLEWNVSQGFINEKEDGIVWFEDENFRSLVVSLHDTDGDNRISYAEAEEIEHLDASARDISSLTGVEKMCNLRSLDISGNPKLRSQGFLDLSDPHYHLTDITIDFLNEADFRGCPAVVWLHDYGEIKKVTGHRHQTIKQQMYNQTRMHHVIVEDTYISTDLSMEGERVYLQRHTRGEGIEILLNYHGFADMDYKAGIMERTGRDFMEELFSKEPFKTFRDCFDFICIKHVSPGRGDNIRHETGYLPQVIGYSYDLDNPERPVELNIVNLLSTMSTPSAICLYHAYGNSLVFTHEFGHQFANLGDEYVEIGNEEEMHPFLEIEGKEYFGLGGGENTFWTLNTCLTNDPEKVPWRRFMKLEQYKNEVGIFEGAELFGKGAYRATERSLMGNHSTYGTEFNPPSRYSIFQEIMRRSEILGDLKTDRRTNKYPPEIEQMLWETFLEYDKKNL